MEYKWKRGSHGVVKPEVVARELKTIQKKYGALTPDVVVSEAKKKRSPIHACFEWDDTLAAEQYRLTQARYIIRSIEVEYTPEDESEPLRVRAFHNIINQAEETEYVTINQARKDKDLWVQVLEKAKKEIIAWRKKYSDLKEFEGIFKQVDKL